MSNAHDGAPPVGRPRSFWSHGKPGAWWNVSRDPFDDHESPLAFTKHRALNRLALRTKLDVRSYRYSSDKIGLELDQKYSAAIEAELSGGALAYLKHDSMGPTGAAPS